MKKLLLIMAISQLISLTDEISPFLTALEGVLTVKQIGANIGEAEVGLFQSHFQNAPANKNGWPTTAFYPRAARATNWQANDLGVVISINQIGIRQRYQGGDIFPTEGHQYLTIPAREEAYGKVAGEFNNLKVAFSRGHAFALVEADASIIKYGKKNKKGGAPDFSTDTVGGGVVFWLVKSVHQEPDPKVLPDPRDIAQVAIETVQAIVDRVGGAS